jgi:tyrosyl-tRNA synthetase
MFSVVTTVCHLLLNRTFANMNELIADYESGALHPADVKPALAKAINQILQV